MQCASVRAFVPPRHAYLHFSLCRKRCHYCAFNTTVTEGSWRGRWASKVVQSMPAFTAPPTFDTVYFGGGTPSLLAPAEVRAVLDALPLAADAEVTLELNPSRPPSLHDMRAAGVNRLRQACMRIDRYRCSLRPSVWACSRLTTLRCGSWAVSTLRKTRCARWSRPRACSATACRAT